MQPVDRLTVHVVVDNTTDMLSSRPKHIASELRVLRDAGMTELAGEALCSAHHGLCLAVSAHRDGRPAPCSSMRARIPMPSNAIAGTCTSISDGSRLWCSRTAISTIPKGSSD